MYSSRHITIIDRYSAPALIAAALAGLLTLAAIAQNDADFKMLAFGGQSIASGSIISSLDVSPDGSMLAVSHASGAPISIYPVDQLKGSVDITLENWPMESRLQYSTTGRYVLVQQLSQLGYVPNRDRPIKYAVVEIATGLVVRSFKNIYAAALTPDESTVLTLDESGVKFTDLVTGVIIHAYGIDQVGNAIAVSRDGKRFALAHGITETRMQAMTSEVGEPSRARQQVVEVFDMATLQPIYTLTTHFEKVFRLEYTSDERDLLILAKPDATDPDMPNPTHSYVQVADALFGEMRGIAYPSSTSYEPDMRISPDGSLIALSSAGSDIQEVDLYDRGTGKMVDRFVLSGLLQERLDQQAVNPSIGRLCFDFLPDNKRMLLADGDRIIEWTYKR